MGSKHPSKLMVLPLIFLMVIFASNFTPISGLQVSPNSLLPGRNLVERNNVSEPIRQSDDTVRVDPLDNLKKYRGGYDITNKHYWSSTIFTGVYGYAIGVLWLLFGIVYGGFLLITSFCCKRKKSGKLKKRSHCHKQCYLWHILLAIFFTVLAIVATGLVLGGNAKFHSRAKTVVKIIIETANEASETIYNTTGAMRDMRDSLGASNGSSEASGFLTSTSEKLDVQAAKIHRQARKHRRLIDLGLKIVYIVTTVTISLNLIAVIALLASGVLRLRRTFYLIIIMCWFLAVIFWMFSGLYFFLDKFSGDTCTALEHFQQNPNNNSLSSILPCDELLSAKSVLFDVSAGIHNLVNEVNKNISVTQATLFPDLALPRVCNPFSAPPEYQYQPDNCPANTIRIGDIPEVLKVFTCSDPNNGTCDGAPLSTADFKTVEAYTNSIQTLLNAYPGMESLVECQSVEDAFSVIIVKHCNPLKKYAQMVWAAMVFLSVIMVLLFLLWATQAHHQQKHHFTDGSVKLHSATESALESGPAKAINSEAYPSSDQ